MLNYFSPFQSVLIALSFILLLFSIYYFHKEKVKLSLVLLFLSSIIIGFFMASLDPFVHIWDEQYHALVAKNMLKNPLKPLLYSEPILEYDYRDWTNNHVWFHKQPLFLWQISLSFKIFGINHIALRIPSILMHALLIFCIYRIGKITLNSESGYYGAIFFTFANYILELIAGRFGTDHNDVAFLFYITASIWSWFEYQNSGKKIWLIFIGLFSGCAILVKWLVGLLVYAIWGIVVIYENKAKLFDFKKYLPLLKSLGITFIVFLPWQIYILLNYPLEAIHEYKGFSEHLHKVVEGHHGDMWFHFRATRKIYGANISVPFFLLIGFILYIIKIPTTKYKIAVLSAVVITYLFYTLVKTKILSFTIIVSAFGFISFGVLVHLTIKFIENHLKKIATFCKIGIPFIIAFLFMNIFYVIKLHSTKNLHSHEILSNEYKQVRFAELLKQKLGNDKYVVFNSSMRQNGHIAVMFYTNYVAYSNVPDTELIKKIKKTNYKIAIYDDGKLPTYIKNDQDILKLTF